VLLPVTTIAIYDVAEQSHTRCDVAFLIRYQ
jgi:hypothetical protein